MFEKVEQGRLLRFGRWEYVLLTSLIYVAIAHFRLMESIGSVIVVTLLSLALQPYSSHSRETLSEYVRKTIFLSLCFTFALAIIPFVLRNVMPVPLAYGIPIFLLLLSKHAFMKPQERPANFYHWLFVLFGLRFPMLIAGDLLRAMSS